MTKQRKDYRTRIRQCGMWIDLGHFNSKKATKATRELATELVRREPHKTDTSRQAVRNK
jgi:hypothetical protein